MNNINTYNILDAGDSDIEYPAYEIRVDTDVLLTEQNTLQEISCQKLAALFAEDLISKISGKNIPVVCHKGDAESIHG